jgi:hypothetical protein
MISLFRICLLVSVVLILIFGQLSSLIDNDQVKNDLEETLFNVAIESWLPDSILATKNENSLNTEFLSKLGVTSVEVYSTASSLVYQNNVNKQTQQRLSNNII